MWKCVKIVLLYWAHAKPIIYTFILYGLIKSWNFHLYWMYSYAFLASNIFISQLFRLCALAASHWQLWSGEIHIIRDHWACMNWGHFKFCLYLFLQDIQAEIDAQCDAHRGSSRDQAKGVKAVGHNENMDQKCRNTAFHIRYCACIRLVSWCSLVQLLQWWTSCKGYRQKPYSAGVQIPEIEFKISV